MSALYLLQLEIRSFSSGGVVVVIRVGLLDQL
jgi:hypothetical protein